MEIFAALLIAQSVAPSATNAGINPVLVLIAGAVAWGTLWANILIIPFYNKRESLSKDYQSSGRINSAIAAIESNRLIKSLAAMFNRALEANPDRRTRPPIEQLLDSATVLVDLKEAQQAMVDIESLSRSYATLCLMSCRLWKWGLSHVVSAVVIVGEYALLASYSWMIWPLCMTGLFFVGTFIVMVYGMIAFHNLISSFNSKLEAAGVDAV